MVIGQRRYLQREVRMDTRLTVFRDCLSLRLTLLAGRLWNFFPRTGLDRSSKLLHHARLSRFNRSDRTD